MEKLERERLVADAILLERAVKVLERRFSRAIAEEVTAHTAVTWIRYAGQVLRRDGEHG